MCGARMCGARMCEASVRGQDVGAIGRIGAIGRVPAQAGHSQGRWRGFHAASA
jgi:hypothetical protein